MAQDPERTAAVQSMDRAYMKLMDSCEKILREADKGIDAAGAIVVKNTIVGGKIGDQIYENIEKIRQLLGEIRDVANGDDMNNAHRKAFSALQRATS